MRKAAKEATFARTFGAKEAGKKLLDVNGNTVGYWRLAEGAIDLEDLEDLD